MTKMTMRMVSVFCEQHQQFRFGHSKLLKWLSAVVRINCPVRAAAHAAAATPRPKHWGGVSEHCQRVAVVLSSRCFDLIIVMRRFRFITMACSLVSGIQGLGVHGSGPAPQMAAS